MTDGGFFCARAFLPFFVRSDKDPAHLSACGVLLLRSNKLLAAGLSKHLTQTCKARQSLNGLHAGLALNEG